MIRVVRLLLLIAAFTMAVPAFAQPAPGAEPLTVRLTPSYPRPYEAVVVTPGSTLIDLSASTVTISVNGTVLQKGTGTQGAAFTAAGSGERSVVTVSVVGPDGRSYSKQVTVRPADVALVVEPVSTVHPFYQGLPFLAPSGRVRLIAIPEFRSTAAARIDPATLIYTWKLGDRVLTDASGIGRSTLTATAPVRYRDADITLTVTNPDQSLVAQAAMTLSPVDPVVRIYANDPLLGPWFDRALTGTFTMDADESTFRAVPYFFVDTPAVVWSVGGKESSADKDITVRSTGGGVGTAVIGVTARRADTLPASANAGFTVRYGESKSPLSIFGL